MKSIFVAFIVALVGFAVPRLFAQEHDPAQGGAHGGAAAEAAPHEAPSHDAGAREGAAHERATHEGGAHDAGPTLPPASPRDHRWPGVLVFLVLLLFFMAAVIGPIVRAQAPPEMPATHSHDEPPGASHHHGHSGTINPVPEDVARLEDPDGGRGEPHH